MPYSRRIKPKQPQIISSGTMRRGLFVIAHASFFMLTQNYGNDIMQLRAISAGNSHPLQVSGHELDGIVHRSQILAFAHSDRNTEKIGGKLV